MYLFILALIIIGLIGIYKAIDRTTDVYIDNDLDEDVPFPETIPEVTVGNIKVQLKSYNVESPKVPVKAVKRTKKQ